MTKRQAYELGYDHGTDLDLNTVPKCPPCIPPEMKADYMRGIHHAAEDRIS